MIEGIESAEGKPAVCQLSQTRTSLIRAALWSLTPPATHRMANLFKVYWQLLKNYSCCKKQHIHDGHKCLKKNILWVPRSCTFPLNIRGNLISSVPVVLPVIISEPCSSSFGKQDAEHGVSPHFYCFTNCLISINHLDSRSTTARQTGRTHWDDVALHDKSSLNTHQGASRQEVEWNWSSLDCHNVIRLSKQASTQQGDWENERGLKCLTVCRVLSLEEICASRHPHEKSAERKTLVTAC